MVSDFSSPLIPLFLIGKISQDLVYFLIQYAGKMKLHKKLGSIYFASLIIDFSIPYYIYTKPIRSSLDIFWSFIEINSATTRNYKYFQFFMHKHDLILIWETVLKYLFFMYNTWNDLLVSRNKIKPYLQWLWFFWNYDLQRLTKYLMKVLISFCHTSSGTTVLSLDQKHLVTANLSCEKHIHSQNAPSSHTNWSS